VASAEAVGANAAFESLSTIEQKQFIEQHKVLLDQPKGMSLTAIWIMVLIVLGGTIFLFGFLGYRQLNDADGGAEALFGLATLALGAIVGLLAPSPTGAK